MEGAYPLPTESCARCGRTLDETGGERIVIPRYWSENEVKEAGGAFKAVAEMLDGTRPPETVQTVPSDWTREELERVHENSLRANIEGRRAWLCQFCAHRLCRVCREPLACPPCSGVVDDDGSVGRHPWMAYIAGCINPACKEHRGRGRLRSATARSRTARFEDGDEEVADVALAWLDGRLPQDEVASRRARAEALIDRASLEAMEAEALRLAFGIRTGSPLGLREVAGRLLAPDYTVQRELEGLRDRIRSARPAEGGR